MLSVLGTHSLTGQVTGLADIPRADQPPMVPLLFYAFRLMAGIGVWFMALAFWSAWIWRKTRGSLNSMLQQRKLLLAWVLSIPLPYIAIESGWVVREVGRQPWVVYGMLRTRDAATLLPAGTVAASMTMFAVFYAVLVTTFAVFAYKWLKQGPDLTALPPEFSAPLKLKLG